MKKLLFALLLLSSCYYNNDLYNSDMEPTSSDWLCYVDSRLSDAEYIQIIGNLYSGSNSVAVNRRCKIFNDSIVYVCKNMFRNDNVYLDATLLKIINEETNCEEPISVYSKLILIKK